MKPEPNHALDKYRSDKVPSEKGANHGWFMIPGNTGKLRVMSSGSAHNEFGELGTWEHVSVSLANRTPTWEEMCMVKRLFWDDSECVIEFHPPRSEYISVHDNCLHLWKPPYPVPRPPKEALA